MTNNYYHALRAVPDPLVVDRSDTLGWWFSWEQSEDPQTFWDDRIRGQRAMDDRHTPRVFPRGSKEKTKKVRNRMKPITV